MTTQTNPFVHKITLSNIQVMKMCVLGLVLLPLRLLAAFLCITSAGLFAYIGLAGLKPGEIDQRPFTGWRRLVRVIICYIIRFMYICLGFIVRVKGEQADSKDAPILVVAPHSTFYDSLPVVLMGAPSVVAKAETTSIPFWGAIIRMSQPVLVHRSDTNSRQSTIKHISERADGENWQQVLIFPEGTCTNRQALITFRLGGFYPCVPVQPVMIRYDNSLDTVTWTWEGIGAWKVIAYTLSQLYTNCTIEYLPPYVASQEEKEDPKKFASGVREVMAKSLGVGTTDCNYFDYLKIEKCKNTVKKLQKLQRKLDISLLELTKDITIDQKAPEGALQKIKSLNEETKVFEDLCGNLNDLRNLKLIAMIATDEDPVQSFYDNVYQLYGAGENNIVLGETLQTVLLALLFLNPKEAKEIVDAISNDGKVTKNKLQDYLRSRKPNYIKVIKSWEGGLVTVKDDILAISANLTKRIEKVAETGSSFLSAGKDAVSDVKGVLNSAVTSLHKRTGSNTEKKSEEDKKTD